MSYRPRAGTAACETNGVITGRDLRDLYEAYHVGPLTKVRLDGDVKRSQSGVLEATFHWGKDGAEELSHNATHIIVQRKTTNGWRTLRSIPAFVGAGMRQSMIKVVDCGGMGKEYRLVGSSGFKMGLSAFIDNQALDPPLASRTPYWMSNCTPTDLLERWPKHPIGDPTHVVGIAEWDEPDDTGWCRGPGCPAVLSASVSTAHCNTGQFFAINPSDFSTPRAKLSISYSGGANDPSITPTTQACGAVGGQTKQVSVKAAWDADTTRTISIDYYVIPRPKSVKFAISPSAAPGTCNPGDTVSVGWQLASDSGGPVTVHAHGQSSTTSPLEVNCPPGVATGSSVEVWALRKDGGGRQVTATTTQPLTVGGLGTTRGCLAGQATVTYFEVSGGSGPYSYTDQMGTSYTKTSAGSSWKYGYRCPSDFGPSELTTTVSDGVGRTATAPLKLNVTCALPLSAPSFPYSEAGGISSSAIRLTWTEVCAEAYRVQYSPADLDGNTMRENVQPPVMIDLLAPNTIYRFTVQALVSGASSAESVAASMKTAPPPPRAAVRFDAWVGAAGGPYSVLVSWPEAEGAADYEAEIVDVSPGGPIDAALIGTEGGHDCAAPKDKRARRFCGLTAAGVYEIEVEARNSDGAASDPGTAVACLGPCGLQVSGVTMAGLRLDWEGLHPSVLIHNVRLREGGRVVRESATSRRWFRFGGLSLKPETTYRAEVRTLYDGARGYTPWARLEFTTPKAPAPQPLALSVTPNAASCLTGETIEVSWTVTGGSGQYTVSLDGAEQTGGSAEVTCQGTAGTQTLSLVATDTVHTTLSATQSISLTVTAPKVAMPSNLSVVADVTELTLKWKEVSGATGYRVALDGVAGKKLPATTLSHPFSDLKPSKKYQLSVRAYIGTDYSHWSNIEKTTLAPPALVLSASLSANTCETGAEVTVSWTATGGSGSHSVTVDGVERSSSPTAVTCQATAGQQSVIVTAIDQTYTQLTTTETLTLTVTAPTPATTLTAQIGARRLADNRVEFRLRPTGGTELTVAGRYLKLPEIKAGRWYSSDNFTTNVDGSSYTLGVISARLDNTVCPGQVEVTFIPAGGERITPTRYKLAVNRAADSWAATSEFAIPLQSSSALRELAQSSAGHWMVESPEGAKDGPGRDGGFMSGDTPDEVDLIQDGDTQAICTAQPTGLKTSNLTSSGARLSWQAVSAASEYDVSVGSGAGASLTAAQLQYDFSGLTADTDHTLRVRARSWRGASSWSSTTVRTKASSVPVVTITSGTSPVAEGQSASFTVSSDRQWTAALTVQLTVSESGSMISGSLRGEVTIAAGAQSATVTVSTEDDKQDESDSVVSVALSAGSGYRLGSPSSAAVTVTDDDGQQLALTPAASSTSCETGGQVTVGWTVTGGFGSYAVTVDGVEQSGSSTSVTCQATAGSQTVTLTATDQTDTQLTTTESLTLTVVEPVTLTASATPTSCKTGGQVTVSWTLTGGSGSYTVTVDGVEQGGSSTSVTCQATAGTQTVTLMATDQTNTQLSVTETLTLTVVEPVTLTASVTPTSCETGGDVTVSWNVSGGSGSHSVTVDGVAQTGASATVTCQATAGTQSVAVTATDAVHTQLSVTHTLSLTVTEPVPPSTVEAQIRARRLSDNRVELTLKLANGTILEPAKRFAAPPKLTDLAWKQSEQLSAEVGGTSYPLGTISVRLQNDRCPSRVEVSFLPVSGERTFPAQRFLRTNVKVDSWYLTATFTITLADGGSDAARRSTDSEPPAAVWLDDTADATGAGPGTEAGLMEGEQPSEAGSLERALSGQSEAATNCPAAPTGLATSGLSAGRITLSWAAVKGASQYDVRRDGGAGSKASGRAHTFSGLQADTAYQLEVRARDAWGASGWSAYSETTWPLKPPQPTGLQVTASTNSLTLTWGAASRATGYEVRIGGRTVKSYGGAQRSHRFPGLSADTEYTLGVRATNRGGASGWAAIKKKTKPTPLSLTASVTPSTCEPGERVMVSWTVTGGSGSYAVTVDGAAQSGGTAKATCQQAPGTQTIVVAASDTKHPTLTASASLSLTVTAPPTVSGQVSARLLSSGKIEFGFRPTGGSRILPRLRIYTPDTTKLSRWTSTSEVYGPAGTERNRLLGKVTVKHVKTTSSYYVDVCFLAAGASQRICPSSNNFYYQTATVDRWLYTGTVTFRPLRASALSGDAQQSVVQDEQMQAAAPGEGAAEGTEGGLMSDEE